MKVLIIEDEPPARAKLEQMLQAIAPSIVIAGMIGSVKETIEWLKHNPEPDLAFVDIQLSDDHSFEIFRRISCNFPVIFTTAYDKYMLESFEFNSIDYLLKPITTEKLKRSLDKIKKLGNHFAQGNLANVIHGNADLKRIIVKKGTEFIALPLAEIAYFYSEHKVVFVRDLSGRQLLTDKNLATLESELNAAEFFRINRKYIASMKSIARFKPDNGKIRIYLQPEVKEEVHVSKETAPAFRKWIGKV